jgi:DNA-binding transcriptional ArsR family regulator
MTAQERAHLERRAKIIKAMAHPSRLLMLEALADGERCVCDLQKLVGADISTVSKHLSLMKAAGLVEDRKEGLWVHYRLRVPCILQFMSCIEAVLNEKTEAACCARS